MSTINGISILTSSYLNTEPTQTSSLETTLSDDLSDATDDELMDVCKEFESYFTEQVFKQMYDMVPDSEEDSSSSSSSLRDYGQDELVKEYASVSTENGGLGLAQVLYEQMKRNYGV